MKRFSLRRTAAALLALTTCVSCSTMEKRLNSAASEIGQSQAKVNLPDLPDDCRVKEPHAALTEGAEARSVLSRERAALDRQNARTDRCATFYDDTKGRLANEP